MIAQLVLTAAAVAGPFGNKADHDHTHTDGYEVTVQISDDGELLVLSPEELEGHLAHIDALPRIVFLAPDGEEQLIFSPEMFSGAFNNQPTDPESLILHSGGWPEVTTLELYSVTAREQGERAARAAAEQMARQAERIAREAEAIAREAELKAREAELKARAAEREHVERYGGQQQAAMLAVQEELLAMSYEWIAADSEAEKAEMREAIEAAAGEMFDLRLQNHEAQLEQMRDRLESLEGELEAQRENRDALIQEWMDERLEE